MNVRLIHVAEILGKEFKIYNGEGQLLFLARDLADCINHANVGKMIKNVDEHNKIKLRPSNRSSKLIVNNEYWFLTEGAVFQILSCSDKPLALPALRAIRSTLKELENKSCE